MIEEYENWEDSIRRTFIELATYMDKNSDPLESIIDFAWASGADMFWVNNAKDELKRLRQEVNMAKIKTKEWVEEVYRANEFAVQEMNSHLDAIKKLEELTNKKDKQ